MLEVYRDSWLSGNDLVLCDRDRNLYSPVKKVDLLDFLLDNPKERILGISVSNSDELVFGRETLLDTKFGSIVFYNCENTFLQKGVDGSSLKSKYDSYIANTFHLPLKAINCREFYYLRSYTNSDFPYRSLVVISVDNDGDCYSSLLLELETGDFELHGRVSKSKFFGIVRPGLQSNKM